VREIEASAKAALVALRTIRAVTHLPAALTLNLGPVAALTEMSFKVPGSH